jgi:hypothetical protein
MNTLDQDLRWDLRYGLQMFCKHSLWLLKYTSLALIGGAAAIVLAAWIWSGVRVWQKEKPVQQAWKEMTGKTPDEYFQAVLQTFPKAGMNDSARQLEEITTRLGIFNPMPNRLYDGARKEVTGPFGALDIPIYVLNQLRRPSDDLDEEPPELQRYLKTHQADLDELYSLIQRRDIPRWETDLSHLLQAPVPQLFYHRQLQGLIVLDILEKTRRGEHEAALGALESLWKISQSLRGRTELLSQLIAISILKLQTEVIRKMERIPVEWQRRLEVAPWKASFLRAMEFDAVVLSRNVKDSPGEPRWDRWMNPIRGPLGKPVRRLVAIERLEASERVLSLIKRGDFCEVSPQTVVDQSAGSEVTWSFDGNTFYTNYPRAWTMLLQTLTQAELTRKILEVKAVRDSVSGRGGPLRLGDMESALCSSVKWVHESVPNGTIQIQCRNLPKWLKEEHPHSTPLKYWVKSASQQRTL